MSRTHTHAIAQPRSPNGSLERSSLEDRNVRLAGLRPRRLRARRHGRNEEHRQRLRTGRVRPHGSDPRGRLQAARRRKRPRPKPLGSRRHTRLRRRDRRRRHTGFEGDGRPQHPVPARRLATTPDLEGRARRARAVRHPRRRRRRRSTRSRPCSTAWPPRSRPTPASRSASSATRALRRESRPRTPKISARRGCSRCRSRSLVLVLTFGSLVAAGHSAPARADCRVRDLRTRRALEPACSRSRCRPRRWCS